MGLGDFLKAFLEKLSTRGVILCLLLVPALAWVVAWSSPDVAKQLKPLEPFLIVAFLFGLALLSDQLWNLKSAKNKAKKAKEAADGNERELRDRWRGLKPLEQRLLRRAYAEGESINDAATTLRGATEEHASVEATAAAMKALHTLSLAEYQSNGRYVVSYDGNKLMPLILADEQDKLLKERLKDKK